MSLRGLNLLVVEDEAILASVVEDMLSDLGCQHVVRTASVSEALAQIDQEVPDVAVLDVNLGGDMIYPVAERLAAAETPFVFMTGFGRGGINFEWAANPVIQKPFNIETLAKALDAVLSQVQTDNSAQKSS